MRQEVNISAEEKQRYYEKIAANETITLTDIVSNYYDFTGAENYVESDIKNFSSNFGIIRELFAIDGQIFTRGGKKGSYAFTYHEALFVRELFERIKTRKIWSKIIRINNRDQLGFYKFYQTTEQKSEFFEELEFFIDGIVDITQSEGSSVAKNRAKSVQQYLDAITHYPIIRIYHQVQSLAPFSAEYMLSINDSSYKEYHVAIKQLELNIESEISNFNKNIVTAILENRIEGRKDSNLLAKNMVLAKVVENMKEISPALYSGLTVNNMYNYLNELETNSSQYIELYKSEKKRNRPHYYDNDETYLFREIRNHLCDAIKSLSNEDFNLLAEDCFNYCCF